MLIDLGSKLSAFTLLSEPLLSKPLPHMIQGCRALFPLHGATCEPFYARCVIPPGYMSSLKEAW